MYMYMFVVTPQVLLQLRCEGLPHGGCEEPVGGARRGCSEGWVQPGGAWRHDPHGHLHRWRPQRLQRRRAQERPRGAPRTPPRLPRTLPPVPLERAGQLTSDVGALPPIRAQLSGEPSADWTSGNHRLQNQPTLLFPVNLNARTSRADDVHRERIQCLWMSYCPQRECIYRFNHVDHKTLFKT